MTRYEFDQLPHAYQLQFTRLHGTLVANRWECNEGISLYFMGGPGIGFWVEVHHALAENSLAWLRSFESSGPLETYLATIELPFT